ncbi:hypothetical protein J2Z21_004823 [Streptomyces griseochromogenes]|uniref:Uncharacterized protein n=1 Tax=Streptomyces griseochromogenes TaxID=68214 RepID=A0ABS4LWS6_9ACTN|nr:hypothetical protein [Streptomyces griseochromogenes]
MTSSSGPYEQTDWVHLMSYENLPGCPRPGAALLG